MKQPLVSVIVTTKNSAEVLGDCLKSVSAQNYKNIELIVVDNNSIDDTKAIAKMFTKHVFNKGPERSPQRNFGVKKSHGSYVFIIDSDMQLSPKVVCACVNQMKQDSKLKGLIIPEESFGKGFWASCKKLERSFYVGVSWMEAARFFDKSAYEQVRGYDEDMVSGEDWDLSQRIANVGKLGRINEFILHNEGRLKLTKTLRKKYYYSKKFARYKKQNQSINTAKQTSLIDRYALYFNNPKKLFRNPVLGLGMLYMKTMELMIGGIGYAIAKGRHDTA